MTDPDNECQSQWRFLLSRLQRWLSSDLCVCFHGHTAKRVVQSVVKPAWRLKLRRTIPEILLQFGAFLSFLLQLQKQKRAVATKLLSHLAALSIVSTSVSICFCFISSNTAFSYQKKTQSRLTVIITRKTRHTPWFLILHIVSMETHLIYYTINLTV